MVNFSGTIFVSLADMAGRTVMIGKYQVYAGVNNLNISDLQNIKAGVYILQAINNDSIIRKRVIKN